MNATLFHLARAVVRLSDWLLEPRAALDAAQRTAPHPEPCTDPVYAVLDGDKRLSFVPTSDGRMAVFAADMEDFVAVSLDRSSVQALRRAITGYLVGTAASVR